MENLNHNEKAQTRICKKWLVIESCSECVFKVLCRYEDNNKKTQEENH